MFVFVFVFFLFVCYFFVRFRKARMHIFEEKAVKVCPVALLAGSAGFGFVLFS